MTHPPILIVDENDKPIGKASMMDAYAAGQYHRIVRVMVQDEKGRVLLQKRSPNMATSPNKWDHSAAGHVDYGETNDEAAAREASEEIGLKDSDLQLVGSWKAKNELRDGITLNRFNFLYKTQVTNFAPIIQESEVSEVSWYTVEEAKRLAKEHPDEVTSGLDYALEHYF